MIVGVAEAEAEAVAGKINDANSVGGSRPRKIVPFLRLFGQDERELFFHRSAVEGVTFEELEDGQTVEFEEGQGPKGPRAENIRVI